MDKFIHVPVNLDFDALISKNVTNYQIKEYGITSEKLAFICHKIISLKLWYKHSYFKGKFRPGYVPLCTKQLRKVIHNCEHCISFLRANKVIYRDSHYILTEKCYGYTLAQEYLGEGITEMKVSPALKRHIMRYEESLINDDPKVKELFETRKGLIDFLKSPLLTINIDEAIKELDTGYSRDKYIEKQEKYGGYFDPDDAIEEIEENNKIHKILLTIINNKSFEVKIDSNGYRLHTPITRLPKSLRKYLLYDGKHLVALDLKNSQPYFSLLLLEEWFYAPKKLKKQSFSLRGLYEEIYALLCKEGINWGNRSKNNTGGNTIMLPKILERLADTEDSSLKTYRDDAIAGRIYESFIDLKEGEAGYKEERSIIKKRFIEALFDMPANRFAKMFIQKYPGPFTIFNLIKSVKTGIPHLKRMKKKELKKKRKEEIQNGKFIAKHVTDYNAQRGIKSLIKYPCPLDRPVESNKPDTGDNFIDKGYTKLANLLQRIESYLLLDVVCKSIGKTNPEIPLITVHDCIATTDEYIGLVEKAIMEILSKLVGYAPKLEKEYWTPQIQTESSISKILNCKVV